MQKLWIVFISIFDAILWKIETKMLGWLVIVQGKVNTQ
jgi:hypothetical protein